MRNQGGGFFYFQRKRKSRSTEHLDCKAHRQRMETKRYDTKRDETRRDEKTLRGLQKINREGKSFFRPQDFFIWPIWSDAFLGGGGNGAKTRPNCLFFCRKKGKNGRKSNDFYWSIATRLKTSSRAAGIKKGGFQSHQKELLYVKIFSHTLPYAWCLWKQKGYFCGKKILRKQELFCKKLFFGVF